MRLVDYLQALDSAGVPLRLSDEQRAMVETAVAAWLTTDEQVDTAWKAIARTGTPWHHRNVRDIARIALSAVAEELA